MKMKANNGKFFNNYLILAIGYIGLFFIVNAIHFHFFNPQVILYSLLFDLIVSLMIVVISLVIINKTFFLYKNALFTLFFLISTSQALVIYAFVVPTAIERSLSVYLLERLESSQGMLSISDFNNIAEHDYFNDMSVIETSIDEQVSTGSIVIIDNKVVITDKGKRLVKIFSFVKRYLLPK